MIVLLALVLSSFVIYYQVVIKRSGRLTANSIFVYLHTTMAIGSLVLLNTAWEADARYAWIIVYTLLAYMIASGVLTHAQPPSLTKSERSPPLVQTPTLGFWLWAALSALIVVLYFQAVGYSAFLEGIRAQFGGPKADVATLRLNSYAGSRYLFPGYVNQFKNALLPSLLVIAVTYWVKTGLLKRRRLLLVLWSGLTLFGLLGTGQRGAFVIFAVAALIFVYLMNNGSLPRGSGAAIISTVCVLLTSTIALGRSTGDLGTEANLGDRIRVAAPELSDRILTANQGSAVVGFRYIYTYTSIQHGRDWEESLVGLLPDDTGSDIDNRIFAYRYGSPRGSSPPAIWGSIYYNFGWAGIALSPILLAVLLVWVTKRGMSGAKRDSVELMGISGVFAVLGFWVAGAPLFFLNNGIVIYIALWAIGARSRRKHERQNGPDSASSTPTGGAIGAHLAKPSGTHHLTPQG